MQSNGVGEALTVPETDRKTQLETVIEHGMQTFHAEPTLLPVPLAHVTTRMVALRPPLEEELLPTDYCQNESRGRNIPDNQRSCTN